MQRYKKCQIFFGGKPWGLHSLRLSLPPQLSAGSNLWSDLLKIAHRPCILHFGPPPRTFDHPSILCMPRLSQRIGGPDNWTNQNPANSSNIRLKQHFHHILFQGRPPVIGCPPHICLNVYMFECLYVHTFWEGCKYWILDIEWQTLRCTKIRRTKNNLSSKINFPVTSTTGSKPSLTSYYWTQSLRHFWGGSINNISELDQSTIRAINRGPLHSTAAKGVKISANLLFPQTLAPNLTYQQMLLKLDIRLTRTPPGSESSHALWLGYVLIYLESHTWAFKNRRWGRLARLDATKHPTVARRSKQIYL